MNEPSDLLTPKRLQIGTDSGDPSDRLLMVGYNGCVLHSRRVLFIVVAHIGFTPVAVWQGIHSNPIKISMPYKWKPRCLVYLNRKDHVIDYRH